MSKEELLQYLKIGALASESLNIAKVTKDKVWHKRLMTAVTLLTKIVDERAKCLDREQLLSVARRHKNTKVMLQSTDDFRITGETEKEVVSCDLNDLETLAELALMHCKTCKLCGNDKRDCEYRKTYHRLGIEVANTEPDGCEYRE